jgi:HSP20 family protein
MSAQNTSQTSNSPTTSRGERGTQMGLTRRSSLPPVPSLLVDPLSIFGDSPFSLFREMQQELNRVFGQNRRGLAATDGDDLTSAIWAPPVELAYRDGNLVVSAELPGIKDTDVQVQINDDVLVIQGERRVEREENDGGIRRTERQYGQFYRAIALPDGAEVEKATAEFQNGVLHIKIPIAQSQMRQIPVQTSRTSQSASTSSQSDQAKKDQPKPSTSETPAAQKVA